jgi:phenylpropionate dioxygenase-like ring-hydroxylating dioxygenase large terminal subunit
VEIPSATVPPGAVVPVTVDDDEFVVWRGTSGALGSAPRRCPHLDWDLADGRVAGDDLVCAGHGWSFDCAGRASKRNERGRVDDKGAIARLAIDERGGTITLSLGRGGSVPRS